MRSARQITWPDDVGQQVASLIAALPEVRWSKAELVIPVGGDRVGYRLLKLPPVPDNELPDMVRLMAEREFGSAPGDGAIDFVPLSDDANSQRPVLAARIRQKVIDHAQALADGLGANLCSIVLRGAALAPLAERLLSGVSDGSHLLLALAGREIDLVVLDGGRPSLLRTTKADSTGSVSPSELQRTLSAVSLQLGHPIDRVVGFQPLKLEAASKLEMTSLDGAALLSQRYELAESDVAAAQQALPVAAAAINAAENERPQVNFLSPRQAVVSGTPKRQLGLVGGAAAATLLAVGWQMYSGIAGYNRDASEFAAKRSAVEKRIEKLQPYQAKVDAIEAWRETDVNWLEELRRLSTSVRPKPLNAKDYEADSDVMLTSFTAGVKSGREGSGGKISFDVAAKQVAAAEPLEQRLRDDRHDVEQQSVEQAAGGGPYGWRFRSTIDVPPAGDSIAVAPTDTEPESSGVEPSTEDSSEAESSAAESASTQSEAPA